MLVGHLKALARLSAADLEAAFPPEEDGSQEEADFIASQGLSHTVVKQAMDAIVQEALRCTPDEGVEALAMEFSVRVACSGVVDEILATRTGGASDRYVSCVADVLTDSASRP